MENEQRIWNKSELETHPEWSMDQYGRWYNKSIVPWIVESMLGKTVQWCKDQGYTVTDEMIAKEYSIGFTYDKKEIEEITKPKTAIASNGTELVVGGRYRAENWLSDGYMTINAIGNEHLLCCENENTREITHKIDRNWLPYTEPKEEPKPLEGYQKWYEKYDNGLMQVCYSKLRPVNINITYYSEQEAIDLGLKL